MAKGETKTIYDLQYRCRRCGALFPAIKQGDYSQYGYECPLMLHLGEWYWTEEDREKYFANLSQLIGKKLDIPDLPNKYDFHQCEDEQMGLGDFIGYINKRVVKRHGRGWKLVESSG